MNYYVITQPTDNTALWTYAYNYTVSGVIKYQLDGDYWVFEQEKGKKTTIRKDVVISITPMIEVKL
jgi:uncharacterized protein affecting Mg2+/Co2+ transport